LKNLSFTSQNQEIEPYLILRGHTGPLYSLAISPDENNFLYTAGNEVKYNFIRELSKYGKFLDWKRLINMEIQIYLAITLA
jgi:WD40 repeat protein